MCALWGGDTDERRLVAGAGVVGREHRADVILSKGCAEPTVRAIIQTPCSGAHLHNFMALHARFSCARASASVSRAVLSGRSFESRSNEDKSQQTNRETLARRGEQGGTMAEGITGRS